MQETRTHWSDRAVDHAQQRAFAVVVAQRACQLQAAPRDLVNLQHLLGSVVLQSRQMRELGLERFLEINDECPGGDDARLRVLEAEAGERAYAELLLDGGLGRRGVEGPIRPARNGRGKDRAEACIPALDEFFGGKTLRRREPCKFIGDLLGRQVGSEKGAGREFDPRQADTAARLVQYRQVVWAPRIE